MKKVNYILSVCFLLVLFACETSNLFEDKEGGFAIAFIGEPVKSIDTFQTELGTVVLVSYMEEVSASNAHMLTYSDYPVKDDYIEDPYRFIDGAKDGALGSLNIDKILMDEKIEIDGVPGVEIKGTNSQNLYIHYKLFLQKNRLFQIGLLKEGSITETAEELEFMESFVFL